jgi:hypothetical protein
MKKNVAPPEENVNRTGDCMLTMRNLVRIDQTCLRTGSERTLELVIEFGQETKYVNLTPAQAMSANRTQAAILDALGLVLVLDVVDRKLWQRAIARLIEEGWTETFTKPSPWLN